MAQEEIPGGPEQYSTAQAVWLVGGGLTGKGLEKRKASPTNQLMCRNRRLLWCSSLLFARRALGLCEWEDGEERNDGAKIHGVRFVTVGSKVELIHER